jgi:hypothetical protein
MTFDIDSSFISSFVALLAAIASAVSAYFMFKQVSYQFRPNIITTEKTFYISVHEKSLIDIWWKEPTEESLYKNLIADTSYLLTLRNIGNGPVYNVKAVYIFDFEEIYKDLNRKLNSYSPGLIILHDGWGARIEMNGNHIGGFKFSDDNIQCIEYIGPFPKEDSSINIDIDPMLSYIAQCYAFWMMMEKNNGITNDPVSIRFKMKIDYIDAISKHFSIQKELKMFIKGERYKEDLSDGLASVHFLNEK